MCRPVGSVHGECHPLCAGEHDQAGWLITLAETGGGGRDHPLAPCRPPEKITNPFCWFYFYFFIFPVYAPPCLKVPDRPDPARSGRAGIGWASEKYLGNRGICLVLDAKMSELGVLVLLPAKKAGN